MVKKKMYKRIQKLKRNGYGKIKITAMLGLVLTVRLKYPKTRKEQVKYKYHIFT